MHRPGFGESPSFCFMMVVWGERYLRYFTDYCLPSLLAPNNIPCIENKADSRFAIATKAGDWAALSELDVFKALERHIKPVFLELPVFEADDAKMTVMSSGHKLLSNYAFQSRAFGININPDSIYSDHTVRSLQNSARRGIKMVCYPGVRFELEGVAQELRSRGMLDNPVELVVPARTAAGIGIRNPHPFTIACHWDNPCFFEYPVYHNMVDSKNTTMIVHTISMGPIMLDYGAIDVHRDEIFEKWTLDGDYAHSNFGHFDVHREIEYVDDSDTFMVLGFTPKNEDNPSPVPVKGARLLREVNKGLQLWRVYSDPIADPLKKRLYLRQVILHEGDLGEASKALVSRDRRTLERHVVAAIRDEEILGYYERCCAPRWRWSSSQTAMSNKLRNLGKELGIVHPRLQRTIATLQHGRQIYAQSNRIYRKAAVQRNLAAAALAQALARMQNRVSFIRLRLDFYVRHYSAQGPAHIRFYWYRLKFYMFDYLAHGKALARSLCLRLIAAAKRSFP